MKYSHSTLILALLMTLHPTCAKAEYVPDEELSESITTEQKIAMAERLLSRSCAFYRNLRSFSMRLTTDLCIKTEDKATHKIDSAVFKFERSRFFGIKMVQPEHNGEAVLNGLNAYFYSPKWHVYVHRKLASPDIIFKESDFSFITDGAFRSALLQELTSEDPHAELMKDRSVKSYDGIDVIDGAKYHHVTLTRKGASCDEQIWLAAGKKPWIREFVPVRDCPLKTLPVVEGAPLTEMTMTVAYRDAKDNPTLRGKKFTAPYRATQASQLVAATAGDARQSLVGRVAPDFKISTVDGGKFQLSRQRGKVTVLEFWATWCSPCCRALPALDEVARSFSDQGVQFIAINQKEELSKIKTFLASKSLDTRVGLDPTAAIAQRYHVVGIPQTVVIGRDGKVRVVSVGYGTELREQITQDLQAAVQKNGNSTH